MNDFQDELYIILLKKKILSRAQLADLVSLTVAFLSLFQTIRQVINKKRVGLSLLFVFSPTEEVEELPTAR